MDWISSRNCRSIEIIYRIPEDVKHASKYSLPYWYRYRSTCSYDRESTLHAIHWIHSDSTDDTVTELLLDFEYEFIGSSLDFECLIDTGDIPVSKFDIDDDTDDFCDDTCIF